MVSFLIKFKKLIVVLVCKIKWRLLDFFMSIDTATQSYTEND